ncbi:potassium/sodium hyperpolarization-activated cyclic nucleotide-gated channel 3 [Aplochiton taeniatus]
MSHLEDYMTHRNLPKALRIRIFDYNQSRYSGKWFNENEVLSLLSKSLKEEIIHVMCANILKNSPMFQNRDSNFINGILLKLRFEECQAGDVIVYKESLGDRMFFIGYGQVLVKSNDFQKELMDGDYFGEISLLTICRRLADVQALSPCQLFSLSRESFQKVLKDFPDVLREFEGIAQQHQATLKRKPTSIGITAFSSQFESNGS